MERNETQAGTEDPVGIINSPVVNGGNAGLKLDKNSFRGTKEIKCKHLTYVKCIINSKFLCDVNLWTSRVREGNSIVLPNILKQL